MWPGVTASVAGSVPMGPVLSVTALAPVLISVTPIQFTLHPINGQFTNTTSGRIQQTEKTIYNALFFICNIIPWKNVSTNHGKQTISKIDVFRLSCFLEPFTFHQTINETCSSKENIPPKRLAALLPKLTGSARLRLALYWHLCGLN